MYRLRRSHRKQTTYAKTQYDESGDEKKKARKKKTPARGPHAPGRGCGLWRGGAPRAAPRARRALPLSPRQKIKMDRLYFDKDQLY